MTNIIEAIEKKYHKLCRSSRIFFFNENVTNQKSREHKHDKMRMKNYE